MNKKKDPVRNREKDVNLSGLYAIPSEIALENGKPRDGVVGCVSRSSPYICLPQDVKSKKPPRFFRDMTGDNVPKTLKNRMLAFWHDKHNASKKVCYLAEKSLYEEMLQRNKNRSK